MKDPDTPDLQIDDVTRSAIARVMQGKLNLDVAEAQAAQVKEAESRRKARIQLAEEIGLYKWVAPVLSNDDQLLVSAGSNPPIARETSVVVNVQPTGRTIQQPTGDIQMDFTKAMTLVCAFILAGVSAYIATHDTQPLKAQTEQLFYQNELEKQKTAQEEERTKQMALAVKQGVRVSMPVTTNTAVPIVIPPGQKVFLARGMIFAFRGESGEAKAATITLPSVPKKTSGSYMLVSPQGDCKIAWSTDWSSDPSPCNLNTFLQSALSREGLVQRLDVHTKGEAVFTM